jgi:hypothetical protein
MIKLIILLGFFLFSLQGYSQEYIQACFTNDIIATKALKRVDFILLPIDTREKTGKCIDFNVPEKRAKTLKKFLQTNFASSHVLTTETVDLEECDIKVTQLGKLELKEIKGSIKTLPSLNQTDLGKTTFQTQSVKVLSGKSATIKVALESVELTCEKSGKVYIVGLKTQNDKLAVTTAVRLKRGETIDVGHFKKDIVKKKKELGLFKASGVDSKQVESGTLKITLQ